jgi:hypothetical protein
MFTHEFYSSRIELRLEPRQVKLGIDGKCIICETYFGIGGKTFCRENVELVVVVGQMCL